jgi:hypothetical protein
MLEKVERSEQVPFNSNETKVVAVAVAVKCTVSWACVPLRIWKEGAMLGTCPLIRRLVQELTH